MTAAPAGAPAAVSARDWGWKYAGRRDFAVRHLDLEIPAGQRVLLLGASGAGKSTLLRALAGTLGQDDEGTEEGRLVLDHGGVRRDPRDARGQAGLVLQDPESQVILARLGDDVAFGAENLLVPRDEIWTRVHEALDLVGLPPTLFPDGLAHPTSALSGGQKQRLALAGVLAMRPGVLLLDEPTANLDPAGVAEVRDAAVRVAAATGATLIVVEHRVEVWAGAVDRIAVLGPSGVLADGEPARVLAERGEELAREGVWVPGREVHRARPAPSRSAVAEAPVLLSGRGLAVSRRRQGAVAASGLDVDLRAGLCTAVVGPNGAGKTTLALTLAGLLAPRAGRVVAGPELAGGLGPDPLGWRAADLVARIGTVFQDPEHQFLTGTVRDELAFGPRRAGRGEDEVARVVDRLAGRLRLTRLLAANPFTLSGGEKRRLSVVTALATGARLLVLDEPTFGQDARTWAELVALLAELLDEGTGILAVTHDTAFVTALADLVEPIGGTGAPAEPAAVTS